MTECTMEGGVLMLSMGLAGLGCGEILGGISLYLLDLRPAMSSKI